MRMFLKSISILVLVSLLIGGLVGCDMLGGTTEETISEDSETATVSLTSYSAVEYADLGATGTPDGDEPTLEDIIFSSTGGLAIVTQATGLLGDTGVNFVPRSLDATMAFQWKDEGFEINQTVGATEITWLELEIDYMDVLLTGGINSFTHLLAAIGEEADPEDVFPVNATIGMSFKADISGGFDNNDDNLLDYPIKISESGYLSAALSGLRLNEEGMPSAGTLNASLNYSAVMNYWAEQPSDTLVYHNTPARFTIALKPISGASLAGLSNFDPQNANEAWTGIRNALWGSTATDCITITGSYKNEAGTVVMLDSIKDQAAMEFFLELLDRGEE